MRVQVGDRIEKLVVEAWLGEGAFGSVYRVRHALLGTSFALKMVHHPAQSVRDRLLLEGHVQSRLKHPNIVRVQDVVEHEGAAGLVMDLVDGAALDEVLHVCRPTAPQIDRIARDVLAAMAHAHREGVVHRDLKPANVLLDRVGGQIVPRVTDFGLVKQIDENESHTRTGAAMGTPMYMAPEQIRNAKGVDARADVYSLGVLLYELITGKRPYAGEDIVQLCEDASAERYTPITEILADLPERMVTAVTEALRGDRKDRPADAGELLALWVGDAPEPDLGAAGWTPIDGAIARIAQATAPPQPPATESVASIEEPAPSRWPLGIAVVAFAVATLGTGIVFGGIVVVGLSWPEAEDAPLPVEPAPVEEPAPVPEPVPVEAIEAEPVPEPAPALDPRPVAPKTPSAPALPAGMARASVDGFRAMWVSGATRVPAGDPMKPGTWELWVYFQSDVPEKVREFTVREGWDRRITCIAEMVHCDWAK